MTVKSQPIDVSSDGAYLLTLPIDKPLLGQYGTLPITTFIEQSAAGLYKVEATFTGYVTQAYNKDISLADATHDFILVP